MRLKTVPGLLLLAAILAGCSNRDARVHQERADVAAKQAADAAAVQLRDEATARAETSVAAIAEATAAAEAARARRTSTH
jgi:hypothetical protein